MIYEHTCPQSPECLEGFDQKQHDPHAPSSLFTRSCPEQYFFVCFPGVKKVLEGKYFADMEEVKQKIAEALKGIKIN